MPEIKHRDVKHDLDGNLHPVLRRVYAGRGIEHGNDLALELDQLLPVSSFVGLAPGVELLLEHRRRAGAILVIGDFDADGATSSALVVRCLRACGFAQVDYLVPNRFEFGYGLTPAIVALAAQGRPRPSLIITVDNGISSHDGVEAARALGMEVLITDHHLPGAVLPRADAIVNPNAPGETFASKHLAGVGVAFYLMAALVRSIDEDLTRIVTAQLDLVALGTVADVVPLDHNNRILVQQGLRRIRAGRCCAGISALLASAGRTQARTVAADLAFGVGPRLNAAGRIDDMTRGIECLLCDEPDTAGLLAETLDTLNRERREIEGQMQLEAINLVDSMVWDDDEAQLPWGLCLFGEEWHQGVVGLVASRVKERLHRPVVAFARADAGTLKGSGRSIPGLHIRDALDQVATLHPGLLDKFGGHAMAAGLSLREVDLPRFERAFDEAVRARLAPEQLEGTILTDGVLDTQWLSLEVAELLRNAGPWGQSFPEPVFDGRFEVLDWRIVGDKHLKMKLSPATGMAQIDAIAFNQADVAGRLSGDGLTMVYRLDVNDYRGVRRPQLVVEYLQGE